MKDLAAVIGGGGTMADAKGVVGSLKKAFGGKAESSADVVPVVVSLADKARKEGLLALEDSLKDIDDRFLTKGVTMAIDGTDPEEMRDILELEVARMEVTIEGVLAIQAGANPRIVAQKLNSLLPVHEQRRAEAA